MIIRNGITKFAAVVLATAMFTGCVEDNESASVTGIRDAKAAQLTALAGLSNAQAEALLITANAEAALTAASTAYQAALAAAAELDTQLKQNALDKANATLEIEISMLKAQAEASLAQAQAQLEQSKADLIKALDNVSMAERMRIISLLNEYDALLVNINIAQNNVIGFKSELLTAEAGIVEATVAQEKVINAQNMTIFAQNAIIANANEIKLSEDEQATAELAYAKALEVSERAKSTSDAASDAFSIADKAFQTAFTLMHNVTLTYNAAWSDASYMGYTTQTTVKGETFSEEGIGGVMHSVSTGNYIVKNIEVNLINADAQRITQNISILTKELVAANKLHADYKASESFKALTKAVADAKAAFAKDPTADNQTLIVIAEQNLVNSDATSGTVDLFEKKIAEENEKSTKLATLKTNLTGTALEDYETAVKGYTGAAEAKAKAELTALVAQAASNVAGDVAVANEKLVANINSIDESIADAKSKIASSEKLIADVNKISSKEELVAFYKVQIAAAEMKIEVLEAQAAELKSQIDTLVATAK